MNDDCTQSDESSSDLRVLVTRPNHQAAQFIQLLNDADGIAAMSLPTLEITFVKVDLQANLQSDIIIFTSVNSVIGAHRSLPLPWDYQGKIAAIGNATANALKARGVTVDLQPTSGAGSEALLAVLDDQDKDRSQNLNVTIIRGDSGREKLSEYLTAAGAKVNYEAVYQRGLPSYTKSMLAQVFKLGLPNITSVTSDLGLTNLLKIVPNALLPAIKKCPLVVNSERCAQLALKNGFTSQIVVAQLPNDQAQVTEILRIAKQLTLINR